MTNINNLIETINKKKAEEKPDTKSMTEANANEGSQEASPEQKLTVGVMGIGHIGGSFAKAYHHLGHKVLACDTDRSMLQFAKISGDVDEELTRDNMSSCDLILLCAYPQAVIDFLNTEGPFIGPNPIVIDCCGTKRVLVDAGMDAAKRFGFTPFEFNGKKYIAYLHMYNAARGWLTILNDTQGTSEGFMQTIVDNSIYFQSAVQIEKDEPSTEVVSGATYSGNTMANCSVAVMEDHVIIVGHQQNTGLSVYKMYMK